MTELNNPLLKHISDLLLSFFTASIRTPSRILVNMRCRTSANAMLNHISMPQTLIKEIRKLQKSL